ncbi:MAG TPA: ABC transporter substrate-binding protein [Acidimicrobiia bacterium]|nr:ABC transporter substrate-binding protein [Acidimicrobiia bacterium]
MTDSSLHARSRRPIVAAAMTLALVAGLFAAALPAGAAGKSLTVGAKNFSGAQAVSQAYAQALEAKGYDITFKDNIGPTEVVYKSLQNGDLDAYADFQGTLLDFLGGTATGDSAATYKALQAKLKGTDIVASKPAPAVDVNGFYVLKATAKKYKLKTVSDLAKVASKLKFGGPPECQDRPLCLGTTSKQLYNLQFEEVKKLDAGGPITVDALTGGDIDVALLFTGSSVIPKNAVLLTDDKGLQPADNPVFLMRKSVATAAALKIVNAVSAKLTTAAYNKMSLDISEKKEDPADVAAAFLKSAKLAK